jgi:hypothetical protein
MVVEDPFVTSQIFPFPRREAERVRGLKWMRIDRVHSRKRRLDQWLHVKGLKAGTLL